MLLGIAVVSCEGETPQNRRQLLHTPAPLPKPFSQFREARPKKLVLPRTQFRSPKRHMSLRLIRVSHLRAKQMRVHAYRVVHCIHKSTEGHARGDMAVGNHACVTIAEYDFGDAALNK